MRHQSGTRSRRFPRNCWSFGIGQKHAPEHHRHAGSAKFRQRRSSGRNLSSLNDEELAAVRNEKIGFVFQSHYLLPQCSVLENVLVPTVPQKGRRNDRAVVERAKKLLAASASPSGRTIVPVSSRVASGNVSPWYAR